MAKRPVDPYERIQPAVNAVFSREEAKLFQRLRKRHLGFTLGKGVWKRLSGGLAGWQRGRIEGTLLADFALMGSIPYVKLGAAETEELFRALDTATKVKTFDENVASKKKRVRNDRKAVRYYIDTILGDAKGMDWLRSRQPRWMGVVDRTQELYASSMDLCLARVDEDRSAIAQCFLDGNPIESLTDIVVTDSDAHKGGKRVLFLDFSFFSGRKTQVRRVVYKPSDVEIDYRIAGKNTPAIVRLFTDEHASGRFPEPHESFFELLDRLKLRSINTTLASEWASNPAKRARLEALLALPTFAIVPRNPGSRLHVDARTQRLPIDTSYGYLEYLPFQPQAPELGQVMGDAALPLVKSYVSSRSRWQWDPRAPKNELDWILDDAELSRPAFRLWGRLMSIACVLLETDLHHQNQRVRGLKPHLIDLENCLIKSCPAPGGDAGTMIPESLRKVAAAGSKSFITEATNNQLYVRKSGKRGQVTWLSVTDPFPSMEAKAGMREALATMSEIREEIANWVQASSLADVIVRHVVEATGNLTTGMAGLQRELLNPANAGRDPEEIVRNFMEDRRDQAVADWRRSKSPYVKEDNPKYGVELPEYNGRDFVDRNVPTYYRRAGSLDLLTWWGETVTYKKQAGDEKDLAFSHYHKNKGLDLLKASLTDKLPKDETRVEEKVKEFIGSAFDTTPAIGGAA